jgi:Phosphatidylinositol N-acetylglucosaminyltransferase
METCERVLNWSPLTNCVCSARTAANWLITSAVCSSTILLLLALGHDPSLHAFVVTVVGLGLVLPTWKWWIQRYKIHIRGPWDIPTAASMQLDGPLQK